MFRIGILAVMRSKSLGGKTIGVMITASHNPEIDNGVKIVDPMGEMLLGEWEKYATELANVNNDLVSGKCAKLFADLKIDMTLPAKVVFARDTRSSGPRLVRALVSGITCVDGVYADLGELTTPQLHYMVRCLNTVNDKIPYGIASEDGYYSKIVSAYTKIVGSSGKPSTLYIDCAHGIGALKMEKVLPLLSTTAFNATLVNVEVRTPTLLNYNCGADFVKVQQKIPEGISIDQSKSRCASFDGDADRLIYYFTHANGTFYLLDGDKISALAAGYIKELVNNIPELKGNVEVGVVQTAYANGNSTRYFEKIGIPVACTETGVKHLHHKAEEFDIGVYFEANGHGTVVFSPKLLETIRKINVGSLTETAKTSLAELEAFTNLINQTVGDAISDLLMVEAILVKRKWTLEDWSSQLYTDLPNRQIKVKVQDRGIFKTTNADRQLTSPAGLQEVVSAHIAKYECGRAFVRYLSLVDTEQSLQDYNSRPSGTEDVVRIYAEAETQEKCDSLALNIAIDVYDKAGGIGERPMKI